VNEVTIVAGGYSTGKISESVLIVNAESLKI
jgi:hypothetical protein